MNVIEKMNAILGITTAIDNKGSLAREVEELQKTLKKKVAELLSYKEVREFSFQNYHTLQDQAPFFSITSMGNAEEKIRIHCKNTPISFYKGDSFIFTTSPVYHFSGRLSGSTLELRNETTRYMDDMTDLNDVYFKNAVWSHPHVADSNSEYGQAFAILCTGSNPFRDILSRGGTLDGASISEFLRSLIIWLSTANLMDMYDNYLTRLVHLPAWLLSSVVVSISEVLFASARTHLHGRLGKITDTEDEWLNIRDAIHKDVRECTRGAPEELQRAVSSLFPEKCTGMTDHFVFNSIYAFWLYTHYNSITWNACKTRCLQNCLAMEMVFFLQPSLRPEALIMHQHAGAGYLEYIRQAPAQLAAALGQHMPAHTKNQLPQEVI